MQLAIDFKESKSTTLEGLNDNQFEAVTHTNGPLLIIAGAGTGKTTVVTRRVAFLIEQGLVKPSEILALTFTEKAAAEMEERIDTLVPYGYTDMWIATFHAFGDRLLRDYSIELGLPTTFKVLTGTEQAIFFRQNLYKFELKHFRPLASPTSHIEALLKHFSRLKDELVAPDDYLHFAEQKIVPNEQAIDALVDNEQRIECERSIELANAYKKYQELMLEAGNLDFGDLLYLSHKLLSENPRILRECHEKFKHILVDEYQDTNHAQNEIIKLLAAKEKNITVVGDDDQSIYRFRGASISNILDFKITYPEAKEVVLVDNYRSTQTILDTAYTLIQNNNPDRLEVKNNINKRLVAFKNGPEPEVMLSDTLTAEADTVAAKILELKENLGLENKDFAILIRANSQAEPFIQSLNMAGVPVAFAGNSDLFGQPEIKMLVAFFKVLAYTDDNLSFYQLATSDLYDITPGTLADLFSFAKRANHSIYALLEHKLIETFDFDKNLSQIYADLKKYRDASKEASAGELLYQFLTEKEYLKKLSANESIENEQKIRNIAKFFERINQFNRASNNKSLVAFLDNLEMMLEYGDEVAIGDIDPDIDAVSILTAHGAKGLEWKVVFIVNLVADKFPSRRKNEQIPIPSELIKEKLPEGDFHLEEERRLFYVAITRAKERLFFTAAQDCGGKRKKKISPFVAEALPNFVSQQTCVKASPLEKIERFSKTDLPETPLPYKFSKEKMRLSRAAIDDYHTCPKKFYYSQIVRIPLLENQALIYGTAIHAAAGRYFGARMRGEKITLEETIASFQQALKSLGFESIEHYRERREAGIETIRRLYLEAERDTRTPFGVEVPFEFNDKTILVNGRYDLVYNSNELAEITDFKTSNIRTQEDANKQIKDSTQMKVYALAWYERYRVIPKTTLHFIESGFKGEKTYTIDELDETREMILAVADGIHKNLMAATPEYTACRWCPFNKICPDSINK